MTIFKRNFIKSQIQQILTHHFSPCLLPKVAGDNIWSLNPAEEVIKVEVANNHLFNDELHKTYVFNGGCHIVPKREYVGINTHE